MLDGKVWKNKESHIAGENGNFYNLYEEILAIIIKIKNLYTFQPVTQPSGIYPTDTLAQVWTAAKAKGGQQPKGPKVEEW